MPRVGPVEDRPMTERGASPYTHNVATAALRLWRRRQLSITFVLVPDKLLDEPFWIRESNQMTTPNYVYIGFQA